MGTVVNPNRGYGALQTLAFVDQSDGFILGPTGSLLVTHDAGASWAAVSLRARVVDLTASGGSVWAAVDSCPSSPADALAPSCTVGVERSANGGRTWTSLSTIPATPYEGAAVEAIGPDTVIVGAWRVVAGPDGVLLDAASGQLMVSGDEGASWLVRPLPCTQGYDLSGRLTVARSTGTIWLSCLGQGSGGIDATVLYRSDNEGTTWTAESGCAIGAPVVTSVPQDAPCGHVQEMVPLDSRRAFAAMINGGLVETTDGGAIWDRVAAMAAFDGLPPSLDFVNPNSGWIAFYEGDMAPPLEKVGLWHTSDGGRTWKQM